jgi:hypothetical protein
MSPWQACRCVQGSAHWPCCHGGPVDETQVGEEVFLAAEGSAIVFYHPALERPRLGIETTARR